VIKVLTLFFIDEVAKYRDYSAADEKGDYARIFEEEYTLYLNEVLDLDETQYIKYLKDINASQNAQRLFSLSTKRPSVTLIPQLPPVVKTLGCRMT
jgi:type III restriction enzyme